MEIILTPENSLCEGVYSIYCDGKWNRCISEEILEDFEVLGHEIQMTIAQNSKLDIELFNTIYSELKPFIGIKNIRPKSVNISIEKEKGNIMEIYIGKYVDGMSSGGRIITDTTYNIYNRLDKIKKSMEESINWLKLPEEIYNQ